MPFLAGQQASQAASSGYGCRIKRCMSSAYLGWRAGVSDCLQWSCDAMRLRMTAEDVSMPAAPKAAMGSVAASAMRTSTERRWCISSRQSANSSRSAWAIER